MGQLYLIWGQASKQSADSILWSTLVSALCANEHEDN